MSDREELAAEEARRWIVRMASGDMQAEELARFRGWRAADPLHARAFEDARAIWRAAAPREASSFVSPASFPSDGRARPRARLSPAPVRKGMPRPFAAAAVAAALLAGIIFGPGVSLMMRADHRAGTVVESVVLPDGSRAALDAGAAIAVRFDGDQRRIELLRGDAWFDVAHDDRRPFRVAALGGITQDIGTAFEVRRGDDAVTVTVTNGTVEVRAPGSGRGLRLHTAQAARYGRKGQGAMLGSLAPDTIAAWRQGEILLDRATVRQAVERIGRYRAAPVFLLGTPSPSRRISGAFRVDRPDEALDAIARMAGLSIYRLGGMIVLRPDS